MAEPGPISALCDPQSRPEGHQATIAIHEGDTLVTLYLPAPKTASPRDPDLGRLMGAKQACFPFRTPLVGEGAAGKRATLTCHLLPGAAPSGDLPPALGTQTQTGAAPPAPAAS